MAAAASRVASVWDRSSDEETCGVGENWMLCLYPQPVQLAALTVSGVLYYFVLWTALMISGVLYSFVLLITLMTSGVLYYFVLLTAILISGVLYYFVLLTALMISAVLYYSALWNALMISGVTAQTLQLRCLYSMGGSPGELSEELVT